jgi:hypothetical protein
MPCPKRGSGSALDCYVHCRMQRLSQIRTQPFTLFLGFLHLMFGKRNSVQGRVSLWVVRRVVFYIRALQLDKFVAVFNCGGAGRSPASCLFGYRPALLIQYST